MGKHTKETIEGVVDGIMEVRELLELKVLPEEEYPLPTFRYEGEIVSSILKELKECI